MTHILIEYTSKAGIYFHHTVTTYKDGEQAELLPESHHLYEVFLLLSGEVEYRIEGQIYHLTPMNLLIIPPQKMHSMKINTSQPYERMVLQFSANLFPTFTNSDLFLNHNDRFSPSIVIPNNYVKQSNLPDLMQQCEEFCVLKHKYIDLRLVCTILQIVETLNELILSINDTNAVLPVKVEKVSNACIQYINQNLTDKEKLSPQNLAKELHISPSHLQHTFKKELNITLHTYIFKQRMQLAKKLLLQGNSPQSVSDQLGYEYYSTFYHNFIKCFDYTPNYYANFQQILLENVDDDNSV